MLLASFVTTAGGVGNCGAKSRQNECGDLGMPIDNRWGSWIESMLEQGGRESKRHNSQQKKDEAQPKPDLCNLKYREKRDNDFSPISHNEATNKQTNGENKETFHALNYQLRPSRRRE